MEVGNERIISKLNGSKESLEVWKKPRREKNAKYTYGFEKIFFKQKTNSTHIFSRKSILTTH